MNTLKDSKNSALPREFFARDPRTVAKELLGKLLICRRERHILAGRIVETEAYLGENDPAAHSASGKTKRNAVIFGPPGHAYVYFIYGKYYCLNVSCLPDGEAGCVLFRALEPVSGIAEMGRARGMSQKPTNAKDLRSLTSGPSRLTMAFEITRDNHNGTDMTNSSQGLWLTEDGFKPEHILSTPRVGVSKAIEQELRYLLDGNRFVSCSKNLLRISIS